MLDKSGREIKVGDFIVYGHAIGCGAGLQYGVVLGFKTRPSCGGGGWEVVRIRGYDDGFHDKVLTKYSYLENSSRILILTSDQLPERVANTLSTFRPGSRDE